MRSFKSRADIVPLGGILLLAGFLRLYRLDAIPTGMHFDVAFNYFDVFRLLRGDLALFFPANNGREPLYFYLSLVGVALFDDNVLAERLTSAVIGIATIPVVYWLARSLFHSRPIALLGSFFLAVSVWHIYYSRYGLRVILAVLLTALTLGWFWRAISLRPLPNRERERAKVNHFALAGLFLSLALYTYTSSRILPLILLAITLCAISLDRARARRYTVGLAITALVAAAIFLPLASYFWANPDQFSAHALNLSLLDPRVNKGDFGRTLWQNMLAVVGMFLARGDHEIFRNIPNRPVFDPFVGGLFLIGMVLLLSDLLSIKSTREARLRALLIIIALVVLVAPSALSDDAPNFTRTLPAVTFVVILPAWAASALWQRIPARNLANIALGIVLLVSAAISFRDYFLDFASSPALYYAFDEDKIDAARWIAQESRTAQVYLAPLWAQDGTLQLYTRKTTLKSFESRDTIILPSRATGEDALIAFPLEQEKKATALGERLGSLAKRELVRGSNGETILVAYRVRANDLPDPQNPLAVLSRAGEFARPQKTIRARWADPIELLGYSVNAADPPKRNLEIILFIQSLAPLDKDYTFSLKVRDDKDRVWGQEDKWLGDNSYATTMMSPGDLVIEKFYPGLDACAPAGDYHMTVEAYDPKTMQVLALTDHAGSTVPLGTTRANTSQGNLYPDLAPVQTLPFATPPPFFLFGYTLTPEEVGVGEDFSLSLFWGVAGDFGAMRHIKVRLRDTMLGEEDVSLPPASCGLGVGGCGLCTLFDLRVPASVTSGGHALFVNDFKIGTLNVK